MFLKYHVFYDKKEKRTNRVVHFDFIQPEIEFRDNSGRLIPNTNLVELIVFLLHVVVLERCVLRSQHGTFPIPKQLCVYRMLSLH